MVLPARATAAALTRVRAICLALPEVNERLSHGAPSWFVRDKRQIAMFVDDHHSDGRLAIWCAAPAGVQADLVGLEAERFFRPPYVGARGWLGVRLDVDVDWTEIEGILADAFRVVAPTTVVRMLDAATASGAADRDGVKKP